MDRGELNVYIELYKRGEYEDIPIGQYPNGDYFYCTKKQIRALKLLNDDVTTSVGYGGAARSGKTLIESVAILMDCLSYPGIAWGLGRKELTILTKTTLVTFYKQMEFYGLKDKEDYTHNNKYNYIEFTNKSTLWLIDTKTKPTDPYNTRFGGFELTRCAIDESNETKISVITKLFERTGWVKNEDYGLKRKVFECFNPDKNHVYSRYYTPWKKNDETSIKKFIQALPRDNPNPAVKEWIDDMLLTADKITIERQINGNFEFDDNPYALCDWDDIISVFENDHIKGDKHYLTADIARFGSDYARIGVWFGWDLVEVISFPISKTTEIQAAIEALRVKYQIAKKNCIADEDGVGGGVVDNCGIKGFVNNHTPFKEKISDSKIEVPTYENLQTQCLFGLAKKINRNEIYISAEMSDSEKEEIREELGTIERDPKSFNKLALTKKPKIKEDIGRSPDWRDMLLMRKYFDYSEANTVTSFRISK
jgi:hypothetical protein